MRQTQPTTPTTPTTGHGPFGSDVSASVASASVWSLETCQETQCIGTGKKKVTLVQFPLRHGTVNGSKVWPIYIYNIIYGQKEWIFINHHFCWCFYWRYPILVPIFSCISKFPGGWLKWPPLDCFFCCSNRLKPPSFNIKPSSKLNHHVRFPPKMVAIWI